MSLFFIERVYTLRALNQNQTHQDFYKVLFNLRATNPALKAGDIAIKTYSIQTSNDDNVFAFLRSNGNDAVLVFLNLSSHADLYFTILDEGVEGKFRNVFNQTINDLAIHSSIKMQAYGYLVFEK